MSETQAAPTTTKRAPTTINSVKMKDGRVVDFPGKRRLQKETFVDKEGKVAVRLDFVNGETRTFKPRADMYHQFVGHGAGQKLGDEMAGIDDLDDAILAVDELIANLNKGEWAQRREASAFSGASILVKALAEYTGKPADVIKEFLKDKSAAEKAALRTAKIPNKAGHTLASIVKRLEEEKAKKGPQVDAAALLGQFA